MVRPFATYCRYFEELRECRAAFATQKQLFESHCFVQLCKVGAEWVLEEPPGNWKIDDLKQEGALEKKIADYVGRSVKLCIPLMKLIERTILSIQGDKTCLKEISSEVSKPYTFFLSQIMTLGFT